jgi:Fe-S-cluster containining protein
MSSPAGFSGVRVLIDQSLVFCVVVCRSLFILLSLSFWPPLYGFVCTYNLACSINTELSSLKTNTHRLVRWYFHPCLLFWTWSLIWQYSISAHVVPFWCVFFVSSCCRIRPVCNVPCNIYSTVFRVKRLSNRTRGINDL